MDGQLAATIRTPTATGATTRRGDRRLVEHVIVPFDGGVGAKSALAAAADLAWRWGARVVLLSTTEVEDKALQMALKTQAISRSGADVEFWIDLERPLDDAVLEAAHQRRGSVVCVASRYETKGLLRRRPVATPLPDAVVGQSPVPVLVIGPEADMSGGLGITALEVPYDASPGAERALLLAHQWAERLRLSLRLLVSEPSGRAPEHLIERARGALDAMGSTVPDASLVVVSDPSPEALVDAVRPDAVLVTSPAGSGGRKPLSPLARALVGAGPVPVLVAPAER